MTEYEDLWRALTDALLSATTRHRARLNKLRIERKADGSLLSEADLDLEQIVVDHILAMDAQAQIVAEERDASLGISRADRVWVIDPIDGTREFVDPDGREFCTVVAAYRNGSPEAALVLAPELAVGRRPVLVTLAPGLHGVLVDGRPATVPGPVDVPRRISATRSAGTTPPAAELAWLDVGVEVKSRTTSQTLDMVRTCVDLSPQTGLAPFDAFVRRDQKVWDGAAGIALALSTARVAVDTDGRPLTPIASEWLSDPEPTFASTVITSPALVDRVTGADWDR
jgi:3'(2'), 5'-bisphosphate nucleotidase